MTYESFITLPKFISVSFFFFLFLLRVLSLPLLISLISSFIVVPLCFGKVWVWLSNFLLLFSTSWHSECLLVCGHFVDVVTLMDSNGFYLCHCCTRRQIKWRDPAMHNHPAGICKLFGKVFPPAHCHPAYYSIFVFSPCSFILLFYPSLDYTLCLTRH